MLLGMGSRRFTTSLESIQERFKCSTKTFSHYALFAIQHSFDYLGFARVEQSIPMANYLLLFYHSRTFIRKPFVKTIAI